MRCEKCQEEIYWRLVSNCGLDCDADLEVKGAVLCFGCWDKINDLSDKEIELIQKKLLKQKRPKPIELNETEKP